MSLDALQETIYDIWEKKTQADEVCRRGGVEAGALDLYVKQYFREKVGLKKLAREKARTMLRVAAERSDISRRVRLFAVAVGLEQHETATGDVAHYTPHFAHVVTRLLGFLFADRLDGIAVLFREAPPGELLVPRSSLAYFCVGSRGALDADVVRADPKTWRNDCLLRYLSRGALGALLDDVDALPEKAAGGNRGVDLDDALWLLLEHHSRAVVGQEAWLRRAFERFDLDAPGLQEVEFSSMLLWSMGHLAADMSPADVHNLYVNVEVLADQGDADVTDDIDDVAAFPKAVIQLDCALARPANCRDYHAMADDAPWPTEAEERERAARPTRATVMAARASRISKARGARKKGGAPKRDLEAMAARAEKLRAAESDGNVLADEPGA